MEEDDGAVAPRIVQEAVAALVRMPCGPLVERLEPLNRLCEVVNRLGADKRCALLRSV